MKNEYESKDRRSGVARQRRQYKMTNKIIFENVSKSYGNFKALDSINLEITEGMFGLLGPNGAGKTTFMKILVTLLEPSKGRVLINGHDNPALNVERNHIPDCTNNGRKYSCPVKCDLADIQDGFDFAAGFYCLNSNEQRY
ncbi:ABC-type multidrug transport system, ATPase component [Candidatus Methanomarinus sp.]|nr:ABC-type multidrug transport system, ATPase component [ANME-2 cluster archaeon]